MTSTFQKQYYLSLIHIFDSCFVTFYSLVMDFAADTEEICQQLQNCIQSYIDSGMTKKLQEEVLQIKQSFLELQDKIPVLMQQLSENSTDHVQIIETLQRIDQTKKIADLGFTIASELETNPPMTKIRALSFTLIHRYSITK